MVTKQAFEVEVSELPTLTPDDMKGWDPESVSLVLEYQMSGWTGRVSTKQHVILRAPDGKATASVHRKYRPRRSADNQRRPLEQWRKRQKREREEKAKDLVNSFGLNKLNTDVEAQEVDVASSEPPWQFASKQSYDARLRMQKKLRDWWEDVLLAGSGATVWHLKEHGDDDWALIAGKRSDKVVHLVAHGAAVDPAAVEKLRHDVESMNEVVESLTQVEENVVNEGPQEPGVLDCLMCERTFTYAGARAKHARGKVHADDPRRKHALKAMGLSESGTKGTYKRLPDRPCEYCGVVMPAKSIGGHQRGHLAAGHIKIADGGDGATQVMKNTQFKTAKAITAPRNRVESITPPKTPKKPPEAVTGAPVKPEPLVVATVDVIEAPVVNGTGHAVKAVDLLNQVRTLISPELIGDLERERAKNKELEKKLEAVTADRDDLQAMFDMITERRQRVIDRT